MKAAAIRRLILAALLAIATLCVFLVNPPRAPRQTPPTTLPPAPTEHACRFWGMITSMPDEGLIQDQLVTGAHSLQGLGSSNVDGWGIAYYSPLLTAAGLARPQLLRGGPPADDPGCMSDHPPP